MNVSVTVSMPTDLKQALQARVVSGQFQSMSSIIRKASRLLIKVSEKLTPNGFTKKVEQEILDSERSPMIGEWKNQKDLHTYFQTLRTGLAKK